MPILIADISVGGLVPAAGDPALTCGQVLRAKIDEDSLVVHELGGADPDLAKYVNLSPLQTLPLNHRGKLGLCLQTLFVLCFVLSYIYNGRVCFGPLGDGGRASARPRGGSRARRRAFAKVT